MDGESFPYDRPENVQVNGVHLGINRMKHKIYFSIAMLALFFVSSLCSSNNYEAPKNETPMYGGIPRTPDEEKADREFVRDVLKNYGTKGEAFQAGFELAWSFYDKGDYAQAMRRFNQAWLVDPNDPRIYNAFAALAAKKGDEKSMIDWYLKGAEAGEPKAQYNLGDCYFHGRGVKKNYKEAAKWFYAAAEQGLEWAENMTGVCYEYGLGVPRSTAEANKWYEKADKHGAADKEKSWRHKMNEGIPPEGEMMKEE